MGGGDSRRDLTRIADALEGILECLRESNALEPEPEMATTCLHPLEARIDLGTTNGVPDWECRICQFRTVVPRA